MQEEPPLRGELPLQEQGQLTDPEGQPWTVEQLAGAYGLLQQMPLGASPEGHGLLTELLGRGVDEYVSRNPVGAYEEARELSTHDDVADRTLAARMLYDLYFEALAFDEYSWAWSLNSLLKALHEPRDGPVLVIDEANLMAERSRQLLMTGLARIAEWHGMKELQALVDDLGEGFVSWTATGELDAAVQEQLQHRLH